jgi:hypothetical protein
MLADVFDDEMTRELPSALRTFTDLDPFVPATAVTSITPSGAITPTAPITPTIPSAAPRAKGLPIAIPELTVVVSVMVLAWSCAFAGALGIVLGHTSEARAPAAAFVTGREPHVAVVMAPHEAITEPTLTAPSKQEQVDPDEPVVASIPTPVVQRPTPRVVTQIAPPARAPARRPGFQRPSNLPRR